MNSDWDFHGKLGVRLVSPRRRLAAYASRQFDPLEPAALLGEPDVSLVAVDNEGGVKSPGHRLGNAGDYQECAFDGDRFWLGYGSKRLSIPFDLIGSACRIEYTDGFPPGRLFSYLRPVIQLSLVAKGSVAIHSAAVSYKGQGIAFAGWAESGKTEMMLQFIPRGASFVSDKWTVLDEGGVAYNFPTPVTVRPWVLRHVPEIARNLTASQRSRLHAGAILDGLPLRLSSAGGDFARAVGEMSAKAMETVLRVSVPPRRLFRGASSGPAPIQLSAPLHKLFFLLTSTGGRPSVSPATPDTVIHRLTECARYEQRGLLALYSKFKYAFPERRNDAIEEASERETKVLHKALDGKDIFLVEVPFPFDPAAACEAIERFI